MKPATSSFSSRITQWILSISWGGKSLICLYISILSGIVLGLQYNAHAPFYSTATIELIIPFGSFWRALHYFSSQAFFFFMLCHLIFILWKNDSSFSRSAWIRLCSTLPVALLLLFTGYILRGDATGGAAGAIAENITLSIPVLGNMLNALLFDIQATGIQKAYTNHFAGLIALGGFCVWPHLRRYAAPWRNHILLTLLMLLTAVIMSTPMEPDRIGLLHIAGPWFFLGLQELLRYIPPFWAGVVVPAALLIPFFMLPSDDNGRRRYLRFIILWLVGYSLLTWVSYGRVHPMEKLKENKFPVNTSEVHIIIPDTLQ